MQPSNQINVLESIALSGVFFKIVLKHIALSAIAVTIPIVRFSDLWESQMLAELKDKAQVTIPKPVVNELGLERGDMFDIVVEDGVVMLIPVVIYPKAKADELEALAAAARESANSGEAVVYDSVEDLISDLHKA